MTKAEKDRLDAAAELGKLAAQEAGEFGVAPPFSEDDPAHDAWLEAYTKTRNA